MKKELLQLLMLTPSPVGLEEKAINVLETYLKASTDVRDYYSDKIGNKAWAIGNGPVKVLLSAHIDEVSGAVEKCEDGIITGTSIAGMDKKVLPGSEVLLLTEDGEQHVGVVEKRPIHLDYGENEVCKKIKIDTGFNNRVFIPGTPFVYGRRCILNFGDEKVCGTGLDDKAGIYAMAGILTELSKVPDKYTIIGLAVTQEEAGLRGATVAAKNINPDISIDFDVTFATDGGLDFSDDDVPDIKLGGGCVIEMGPDKSRRLVSALRNTAVTYDIPYQFSVAPAGGTNTDAIQLFSGNCETAHIAIPNRSMHTPVEVCSWVDINAVIDLMIHVIRDEEL